MNSKKSDKIFWFDFYVYICRNNTNTMKTLFLTFGLLLSTLSFSQKIIIHVLERQEMVCYKKTTLDSVILYPDYVGDVNNEHTKYIIDLNAKTSTYTSDEVQFSVIPIEYEDYGDNTLKIRILEDGFDYGLLVNTKDETVMWYWFTDYMTTIKKISKSNFEKPS